MGLYSTMDISATGLTAQRMRMDVISNNLANVNTTRTTEGGPFKRSRVVLRPREEDMKYRSPFLPEAFRLKVGTGVRVIKVEKDEMEASRLVYDPTHPDSYKTGPKKGYVEFPNIDVVTEMVDMISASRSYEANATVMQTSKQMFQKALEIGAA